MRYITIPNLGNDIYVFDEEDNLCPKCSYLRDEGSTQCLGCNIFHSDKNKSITGDRFYFKKNISVSWYIQKKEAEKPSKRSPNIMTWLILKYKQEKEFVPHCSYLIAMKIEEFLKKISFEKEDILICQVPDSEKETYRKGELLSEEISKITKITALPLLKKVKDTEKQHSFGKGEIKNKFENIRGAFALDTDSRKIKDKIIFLIDDVVTSMATINECSKVLKLLGAKEIYVFSLGRNILSKKKIGGDKENEHK